MDNQESKNTSFPSQIDIDLKLLEQTYENLRGLYNSFTQWLALLAASWAVITGFSFQKDSRSAFLVFIGGVILMLVSYELSRAGAGVGSLAIMGLIYEKKVGIPKDQSYIVGTVLLIRGKKFSERIIRLSELGKDFSWFTSIKHRSDYNFFNLRHSKTSLILMIAGIGQCLLAIYLCICKIFPFISN